MTILLPGFGPTQWLATVQSERINVTFMVPMMMQAIIDHPRLSDYDVSLPPPADRQNPVAGSWNVGGAGR